MKTDALFYRLFQTLPELVFELAGLDEPDGRRYRFRSEEVKQTALVVTSHRAWSGSEGFGQFALIDTDYRLAYRSFTNFSKRSPPVTAVVHVLSSVLDVDKKFTTR